MSVFEQDNFAEILQTPVGLELCRDESEARTAPSHKRFIQCRTEPGLIETLAAILAAAELRERLLRLRLQESESERQHQSFHILANQLAITTNPAQSLLPFDAASK